MEDLIVDNPDFSWEQDGITVKARFRCVYEMTLQKILVEPQPEFKSEHPELEILGIIPNDSIIPPAGTFGYLR